MVFTRPPYSGFSRKLVLAFDIGTTYSGVSYALLDPGAVPKITSVSKFLNNHTGTFKISSTMFYDHDGTFRGVEGSLSCDEIENLRQVRWWKLKNSPGELPNTARKFITPDLPKGKKIQDIFADFIRYLYDSTEAFIREREPMGNELWERIGSNIDLILSHPNGWGGPQQELLRKSVVQASVFTEEEALSRVSFVTEGEATFNHCVIETQSHELLKPGHKVLVVDAGGGSVDISSYDVTSAVPLEVVESHQPKCSYQGGEVVTAYFQDWAKSKLQGSRFATVEDLKSLTERFDTGLKRSFSDADSAKQHFVKFGSHRDNDPSRGVKNGRLSILGSGIEKFFENTVDGIVEDINALTEGADASNTSIFLTGGFAASPWIFNQVTQRIATRGLKLSRPNTITNKAVADGSVSYYLDHFVVGRIVKHTYGIPVGILFDPEDPEHQKRRREKYISASGQYRLKAFCPTNFKGERVLCTQEFRRSVSVIRSPFMPLGGYMNLPVIRYTGKSKEPRWMDEEEDKYETLSHIRADIENVPFTPMSSPSGLILGKMFEIIYSYGGTAEIKAQLAWDEDGEERRSEAAVLYDNE